MDRIFVELRTTNLYKTKLKFLARKISKLDEKYAVASLFGTLDIPIFLLYKNQN